MSVRLCVMLLVVCLSAAGCRRDPNLNAHLDAMRAEYLALEDAYYELNYKYGIKKKEAETLREENSRLKKRTNGTSSGEPRIEMPDEDDAEPGLPRIELGEPTDPTFFRSSSKSIESDVEIIEAELPAPDSYHADLNGEPLTSEPPEPIEVSAPKDMRVTHVVINPYHTAGHDFDNKPGDDGIAIVIEPRNADDQFVPKAGSVSIVVLDPAVDGEAARVARWDLDATEANERLRTDTSRGRGINLKLPWPGKPPQHTKLHLFVRYETDYGKKLEADAEVFVALPGQFSQRWTPKSSGSTREPQVADRSAASDGLSNGNSFQAPPLNEMPHQSARPTSPAIVIPSPDNASFDVAPTPLKTDSPASTDSPPRRPVWQPFR